MGGKGVKGEGWGINQEASLILVAYSGCCCKNDFIKCNKIKSKLFSQNHYKSESFSRNNMILFSINRIELSLSIHHASIPILPLLFTYFRLYKLEIFVLLFDQVSQFNIIFKVWYRITKKEHMIPISALIFNTLVLLPLLHRHFSPTNNFPRTHIQNSALDLQISSISYYTPGSIPFDISQK